MNALFKAYRCPSCDQFFNRAGSLETHSRTCKVRVEHYFPEKVYQLRETLFDKLDAFDIRYMDEQMLFRNLVYFDSESICVEFWEFKVTETTTWIGKLIPFFVWISSKLVENPIFLCKLTLVTWCHPSWMLWKTLPHRLKRKWEESSCKLKQQYETNLHRFSNFLINVERNRHRRKQFRKWMW